ncbi:MAG: hypothetical protein ACTHK0_02395 [Ginsengibacter sp.]
MRNTYTSRMNKIIFHAPLPKFSGKSLFVLAGLFLFFTGILFPFFSFAQPAVTLSYSYENITRNNGGGTLEKGDIIEVHALMYIQKKTTKNIYYLDTIRQGTQFVSGSLKIVTNEGINFAGPYTDASDNDLGVYDASGGTSRIRVNFGSGAAKAQSGGNLTATTGGGSVTPGTTLPKFYSGSLFMVAYQLKITANFGDTIYLTGNYNFDTTTSGPAKNNTFHFEYPGIKIIQNSGLCTNFSSASFTADSSFGSGNTQNRALPAIVPGYNKVNLAANDPGDGNYAIANNTSPTQKTINTGPATGNADRVFGVWDIIGDHTGAVDPNLGNPPTAKNATGGYMLVVNAAFPTGEAFRQTISDLCPNTNYEFSAWVRNICGYCGIDQNSKGTNQPGVLPNLTFAVNDVDYYTTGDIPWDKTWKKRGFMYKTGPNETSFTISIRNNAPGGGGNDWVLDDIKLATCYPNLIMNPNDTASACSGSPISITDTVKSYFNNYNFYRWEKSTDGINWIPLTTGNTKTPVLQNGLYLYYVDTVINPSQVDSGTFLRLKVATSLDNLTDGKCAVNNSQKVFLKVYTPKSCPLLDTRVLNFGAALIGDRSLLKWSSQNEEGLLEYEIEKSTDGIYFYNIGKVAARRLNDARYSFQDPDGISNTVYYRLKLIKTDKSSIQYSKIISLYNRNSTFKITAVNPFKNILKLEAFLPAQGNVEFNLCDIYGNVVYKKMLQLEKGNSQFSFDNVYNLPAGIYILRAAYNGSVSQNKLIKTN